MPFDPMVSVLILLFVFLAMLCIGLSVTGADIAATLKNRKYTGRALVANLIVVPLVAFILVALIPMPDAAARVLLLLGFAPGGINALQFTAKVPGHLASAAGLFFLLTGLAIIITPLVAPFILERGAEVVIPYGRLMVRVGLVMVLPLAIGMALRRMSGPLAEKLYKPALLTSTLSFVASVIISTSQRQEALGSLGSGTFWAYVAFILVAMAVGWIAGGPDRGQRQVMGVVTNMRNVGLVYVIVSRCCTDPMLEAAVLAFMALMVLPNLILAILVGVWQKRHAA